MDDAARYRRLARLFTTLLVLGCVAGIFVPAGLHWDFGNFYDAGRRILAGQLNQLYDPHSLIDGQPPQATTGFWGTPLSAYLYVPIGILPPIWGMMFFKLQTALFNGAALVLLYRLNRRFVPDTPVAAARFAAIFAFVSLIYQPLWVAFRTGGQTTPMVFFCLVMSLVAATRARPFGAALWFAFAVMIKPVLITAIGFFALLAGVRYIKQFMIVFLGLGLISLAACGWYVHERFFQLMLEGLDNTVPWFYNSGLYVTLDNLKVLAAADSWPSAHPQWLSAARTLVKLTVVATIAGIVVRAWRRKWTGGSWAHFSFLMSLCFFALLGHIVYEAYLTFLFIVLAYLVASGSSLSRQARLLLGGIFFFSFWQNIIWVRMLQAVAQLDSVPELIAIGLFKSGPLILLLVLLWRHWPELLDSYQAKAWTEGLSTAAAARTVHTSARQ